MISYLLAFSTSIFVPFSSTADSTIYQINASLLSRQSFKAGKIVALALKPGDDNTEHQENFHEAAAFYEGKATFYDLEPQSASKLAEDNGVQLPCIFVYNMGFLIGCYPYPGSENSVIFLLKTFIEEEFDVYPTVTKLIQRIGNTPFTLITTPKNRNRTLILSYDASYQMGPIEVVCAEPDVFLSLGFNPNKSILFRTEDANMVEASPIVDGLYEQSYPVYRNLMSSDLRGNDTIIFALVAPSITPAYQDFLFDVGLENRDFVVGFLPPSLHAYAENICKRPINENTTAIVCFNFDNGFFYPVDSEFPDSLYKANFDLKSWIHRGNNLLQKIRSGEIQPEFLSEEEPPKSETNVQKIVGTTYEDFVMDPTHDVVVLYKRDNCPHCGTFMPLFEEFAEECKNITTLKFGWIDVVKNSARKVYPYMPGVPHVQVYPALNKSNDEMMRGGRDKASLQRVIKRVASFDVPFEPPPPDKASVAVELIQILFGAKEMPEEEQIKAMKYVDEMNKLVNQTETAEAQKKEPIPDVTQEL